MLKQRVVTALVLLLILLPALFYHSPTPFCAVTLVLIAAGAWEWAKLNGYGPGVSLATGLACVLDALLLGHSDCLSKNCHSCGCLLEVPGCLWVPGCCAVV